MDDEGPAATGEGDRPSGPDGPGLWSLATLGLTAGVCLAIFVGGGLWLDSVTKRSPLFVLLGVVLGVVAAVTVAYREIRPFL
ncbi:MAG: AtpZ/AtpI family protein [Acidobacteriota bacterium]|nr:AtpZ/AtpI family protein [Acidobacteriota bacterium]